MSEYEGHSDIIYSDRLDERIKRLSELKLDLDLNEDGELELEALLQFREDVRSECGGEAAWNESSGFIADTYFDTYVANDMAGMYGSEVIDGLDRFLDWGAIKDEYMSRFTELDFDGVTYWVDNDL